MSFNSDIGMYASCLVARIHHFHPELPSFERHQDRPKIGPAHASAIYNHTRQAAALAAFLSAVPLDSPPDRRSGYLEIAIMLGQVPGRQSTLDLLHQISQ